MWEHEVLQGNGSGESKGKAKGKGTGEEEQQTEGGEVQRWMGEGGVRVNLTFRQVQPNQ